MTTTTNMTNMTMALLFHDADISDGDTGSECECDPCDAYEFGAICECDECCFRTRQLRWEAEAQRAEEHAYGVCMECGIGLNDANEFVIDWREKQCDCYTCDTCFGDIFGEEALVEAVSWRHDTGVARPQHTRVSFS